MQLRGHGSLHVKTKRRYREHPTLSYEKKDLAVSRFQNDETLAVTVAKNTNITIPYKIIFSK